MKEIWIQKNNFIGASTGQIHCPFETRDGNKVGRIVPYIYRDLELREKPVSARLQVTALGIYEPWINGKQVGSRYFAPGWTDYRKLVYVQTLDVTAYLNCGHNRFGAVLGDGWFAGNLSLCRKTTYGDRQPELAMVLKLRYADGTEETVGSDESFRFLESNVRYADYYMGQWTDHNYPGPEKCFVAGGPAGLPVHLGQGTDGELLPDYEMAVQEERRMQTVSIRQLGDSLVLDFGQNFVGIPELVLRGKRHTAVTAWYGEMLNPDGSVYTANLRGAASVDRFVCAGEGEECFRPSLTFHGFRYMQLQLSGAELIRVEGIVLTSILPKRGEFVCDNPMINQLYSNIIWGMRGNFVDLPTDCPQRDERLGWCGDTQVFCPTAMYNLDCRDFYKKYLRNVRDTINEDGAPYDLAPYIYGLGYGTAAWADAIVVIPYQHYRFYGDKSVIYENLEAMEGWVEYQNRTSRDYIRPDEGYGDWLSVRLNETPRDMLGTAYFAYTAQLLSELCGEIGETEKEQYYKNLSQNVKNSFRRHYVQEDGFIQSDSQCAYLLAIGFSLVDGALADRVSHRLVESIHKDDDHLTCGFVGISLLLPVLSKIGRNDLAYKILLQDTYPSWGYSIKNGATTIWERWNSYTKEHGFGDVAMNSFNHYSLGSCGQWFSEYMCGIQPTKPGFAGVRIAPQPDPQLRIRSACASYQTEKGTVRSSWQANEKGFCFTVDMPEGLSGVFSYGGMEYPLKNGQNTFMFERECKNG